MQSIKCFAGNDNFLFGMIYGGIKLVLFKYQIDTIIRW